MQKRHILFCSIIQFINNGNSYSHYVCQCSTMACKILLLQEHNISIDAISSPADKACSDVMPPHTGEYHKHIVEFVSTDEKATELTKYITQTNKNVFVRKVQVPHSGHEGTPPCHAN